MWCPGVAVSAYLLCPRIAVSQWRADLSFGSARKLQRNLTQRDFVLVHIALCGLLTGVRQPDLQLPDAVSALLSHSHGERPQRFRIEPDRGAVQVLIGPSIRAMNTGTRVGRSLARTDHIRTDDAPLLGDLLRQLGRLLAWNSRDFAACLRCLIYKDTSPGRPPQVCPALRRNFGKPGFARLKIFATQVHGDPPPT